MEEKMKVAELIAEAWLLEQKEMIQNEAEMLKIKERLAKIQAKLEACNNMELEVVMKEATPTHTMRSWMMPG